MDHAFSKYHVKSYKEIKMCTQDPLASAVSRYQFFHPMVAALNDSTLKVGCGNGGTALLQCLERLFLHQNYQPVNID